MSQKESINFCGLTFSGLTRQSIFSSKQFEFVVTANAQIISLANSSPDYRHCIETATITFDGQVPFLLARLLYRHKTFEKISGSDLVYDVIARAKRDNDAIFILGGLPEVNQKAVARIQEEFGVRAAGLSLDISPDGEPLDKDRLNSALAKLRPRYLFVALGAPKQEYWISRNIEYLDMLGCKIAIGCGGSVDFIAQRFKRAPKWIQIIGLEGVYRLAQQPSTMRLRRLLRSLSIFYIFLRNLGH